jgi:hypothetical protein
VRSVYEMISVIYLCILLRLCESADKVNQNMDPQAAAACTAPHYGELVKYSKIYVTSVVQIG